MIVQRPILYSKAIYSISFQNLRMPIYLPRTAMIIICHTPNEGIKGRNQTSVPYATNKVLPHTLSNRSSIKAVAACDAARVSTDIDAFPGTTVDDSENSRCL